MHSVFNNNGKGDLFGFLNKRLVWAGPETFEAEDLQSQASDLLKVFEQIDQADTNQAEVEKKRPYQDAASLVDSLLLHPDFDSLSHGADPEKSSFRQNESRRLFMNLLKLETGNFDSNDILGPSFGNDAEANKNNFPFIFNEWLNDNHTDIANRLSEADREANELQPEDDIAGFNKKITALNKDIKLKTSTEIPGTKKYWEDYVANAQDVRNRLHEASGNTARSSDAALYTKLEEGAQDHIDFGKAKLRLKNIQNQKEEAEKAFTKEGMNADELTRLALRKFQEASAIVDEFGKGGLAGETRINIFNPAVRRMLIISIYRNGIGAMQRNARNEEVYYSPKDLAGRYGWTLTQIAKSERFNRRERGQHLTNDQRDALELMNLANGHLNQFRQRMMEKQAIENALVRSMALASTEVEITGKTFGTSTETVESWFAKVNELENEFVDKAKNTPQGRAVYTKHPEYKQILLAINVEIVEDAALKEQLTQIRNDIESINTGLISEAASKMSKEAFKDNPELQFIAGVELQPNSAGRMTKFVRMIESLEEAAQKEALGDKFDTFNKLTTEDEKATFLTNNPDTLDAARKIRMDQLRAAVDTADITKSQKRILLNLLAYEQLQIDMPVWEKFVAQTGEFMKNPDSAESRAFLERARLGRTIAATGGMRENMLKFSQDMREIDLDYNASTYREAADETLLLREVGINIEGAYEQYTTYIKDNPEMLVGDWDHHLSNPDGIGKLKDMFAAILPDTFTDGEKANGKTQFLATLESISSISTKSLSTSPDAKNNEWVAFKLYNLIKSDIVTRERIIGHSELSAEEIKDQLEGITIGEKATEYFTGAFDMLVGPGQSPANRAAGLVMVIAAWKLAKKAYRGEGKLGKSLQLLAVAGAAELGLKEWTGRGILDRAGLFGVAEAIEGTFEDVLVEDGKEYMENLEDGQDTISPTEHTSALLELNKVPFHEVMEWYEKSSSMGQPLSGQEDAFPGGIDTYNIVKGAIKFKNVDEEKRARYVVRKTVEQFMQYVGQKDGRDRNTGKNILKERYVDPLAYGSYEKDKDSVYTEFIHEQLMKSYSGNRDELTWQVVMYAEINPSDVERVKGKDLTDIVSEKYQKAKALFFSEMWNPTEKAAKDFWNDVEYDYAPSAKRFIQDTFKEADYQLEYAGEYIEVTYGANKDKVAKIWRDHVELVKEGVMLPFELLYAVDQAVVPWVGTKMRQIREIVRNDQMITIKAPLQLKDLVENTGKPNSVQLLDNAGNLLNVTEKEIEDPDNNKLFSYLGRYTYEFLLAGGSFQGGGEAYHEDAEKIGYYISQVTAKEAGISNSDSASERLKKMRKKSLEKAYDQFERKNPNLSREEIEEYVDGIHEVIQVDAAGNEKAPTNMYIFWRMPLENSSEFFLKETGRFPGYLDAANHKIEPPFAIDPSLSVVENLKNAMVYESKNARIIGSYAGIAFAQWFRVAEGIAGTAGTALAGTLDVIGLGYIDKKDVEFLKTMLNANEETKQQIDELSGSAAYPSLALSNLYKVEANAEAYKDALDKARKGGVALDLTNFNPITTKTVRNNAGQFVRVPMKYTDERGQQKNLKHFSKLYK